MLVTVIGILISLYASIEANAKVVVEIYEKQFTKWIAIENAQYNQYRKEREEDFRKFTEGAMAVLNKSLNEIKENEASILSSLNANISKTGIKAEISASEAQDAARQVEGIKEKASTDQRRYHHELNKWKRKYGQ